MLKPPNSEGTQSETIPSSPGTSLHFDSQLGANLGAAEQRA
ncbi:hypothetical protein A2U01_0093100, partial [Trifolium medium]|nr:hypothetical protein [Trifolium medium]